MVFSRRSFARSVAGLGMAAALFVGCNGSQQLDTENLQTVIAQGLKDQAGVVATVVCPDRPLQQGDVFNCQGTTQDGTTLLIQVTQTDSAGHVNWQVVGSN